MKYDRTEQNRTEQNKVEPCKNYSQVEFVGSLLKHGPGFAGAVFNINALSPTLTTMAGGGRQPHIVIEK